LEKHCPYFKPAYLDHLAAYRFKPEQVRVKFIPKDDIPDLGRIDIEAHGLWAETIMWEVPLMACLSETYFLTDDTDWNYHGQAGEHHVPVQLPCIRYLHQRRPLKRLGGCLRPGVLSASSARVGDDHGRSKT
jgi:nicotinic acid phosphoribosyltransferase